MRASASCSLLLHIKELALCKYEAASMHIYAHLAYNFKSTSHEEVASKYILGIIVNICRGSI